MRCLLTTRSANHVVVASCIVYLASTDYAFLLWKCLSLEMPIQLETI